MQVINFNISHSMRNVTCKLAHLAALTFVALSVTLMLIAPLASDGQPLTSDSVSYNSMLPTIGSIEANIARDTNNHNYNRNHRTINARHANQRPRDEQAKGQIYKRSFVGLGCLGVYDKSKFARLDRVCEDCYQLYREPDIHAACRADCFRNDMFNGCVDALLLTNDQKKLSEMVEELYGK